jgi:Capsule assembly protein Wzi
MSFRSCAQLGLLFALFAAFPETLKGQAVDSSGGPRQDKPDDSDKVAGSPYVELDSWIYPALERLAALGYFDMAFLGMRPWTRFECAILVEDAGHQIKTRQSNQPEVSGLYGTLLKEFQPDLDAAAGESKAAIHLESLYSRAMEIAGQPLNDSYHIGQTIINNYGRPYQQGFNTVDGFSGWASAGRFTIYMRGEYQHAPSPPAYPNAVRNAIALVDQNPVQPMPISTVNQFRLYMPRVPGLSKMDFRVEAVYTDPPTPRSVGGQYVYWNDFYHDLYTNKGNLIGDWIGREG